MDTREAFETLLEELQAASEKTQQSIQDAVKRSDFPALGEAAKRGETIQEEIARLEGLQQRWRSIVGGERVIRRPKRARRGTMVPQKAYRLPILQALEEMAGRGRTADVLDRVGELMEGQLTELDYEMLPSGTAIRWRNKAQWARNTMVNEGLLASDSPRGIWEITEKGRKVLQAGGSR